MWDESGPVPSLGEGSPSGAVPEGGVLPLQGYLAQKKPPPLDLSPHLTHIHDSTGDCVYVQGRECREGEGSRNFDLRREVLAGNANGGGL